MTLSALFPYDRPQDRTEDPHWRCERMATMTQVKERPILFSAPMVRAILDGKKTQTRRTVQPQPAVHTSSVEFNTAEQAFVPWDNRCAHSGVSYQRNGAPIKCRYGRPGDRLWVQEEHVIHGYAFNLFDVSCSGDRRCVKVSDAELEKYKQRKIQKTPRLMRARFMYRSFSRITLEITGVRCERLHDISEPDAAAEGVERNEHMDGSWSAEDGYLPYCSHYPDGCECFPATARDSFKGLWLKINGEKSWKANPWVWVVEFKRIAK